MLNKSDAVQPEVTALYGNSVLAHSSPHCPFFSISVYAIVTVPWSYSSFLYHFSETGHGNHEKRELQETSRGHVMYHPFSVLLTRILQKGQRYRELKLHAWFTWILCDEESSAFLLFAPGVSLWIHALRKNSLSSKEEKHTAK